MQRLLMGEVGSGKTVVALYAMLRAVEHGHQAALMAPTETLAEQHFATLQQLLGGEPVAGGAADRLDPRTPARGHAGQARQRRAVADRRHARADRARRALPLAGGGGDRRAAPLRRAPARGARQKESRSEGARSRPRAARAAHDRHADPAHARAGALRRPRHERRCASCRAGGRRSETRIVAGRAGACRRLSRSCASSCSEGRQAYVVCPLVEEAEGRSPAGASTGGRGREHGGELRAATAEFERLRGGRAGGISRWRCCTGRCARARSRRRWPRSPRARPTCWSRRP